MRIGIPTETLWEERRVVLAPAGVDSLIRAGHTVNIQSGAGDASHFTDQDYRATGASNFLFTFLILKLPNTILIFN